ncbi:MAG: F0F1 ATP synthase subunit delta, partial [Pseudomonadota bacterium]|nr:F0F1 ATP synthase subunit delta [Pseudomonadota bacterium]
MAELATIARPYAEALFKADGVADAAALADEVQALAEVASNAQLRQFADNPKVDAEQVYTLVSSVANPLGSPPLSGPARNLLRAVIENGRLAALPEVASQF